MQTEIGEQFDTQVGLRTLNQAVHDVKQPTEIPLTSVPPIVMLDAIWLTLLSPTGERQTDRLKRIYSEIHTRDASRNFEAE